MKTNKDFLINKYNQVDADYNSFDDDDVYFDDNDEDFVEDDYDGFDGEDFDDEDDDDYEEARGRRSRAKKRRKKTVSFFKKISPSPKRKPRHHRRPAPKVNRSKVKIATRKPADYDAKNEVKRALKTISRALEL